MYPVLRCVVAAALLATAGAPVLAQSRDRQAARDAAERSLDRGTRLRLIGAIGAGMSVTAMFMPEATKDSHAGAALATAGVAALGAGVVGEFTRQRARARLDALNRTAAGLDGPARDEAERALRRSQRLGLLFDVGSSMFLATAFFPSRQLCGGDEACGAAGKSWLVAAAAALGVGVVGGIKMRRAEDRLEALDRTSQADHRLGVAPLRDGVAAAWSVAW